MAARFAYSRWDGTQKGFDFDADVLFDQLNDDLLYHGDINSALRRLMQQGMTDRNGERIQGLRELLDKLRQEREDRLDRFDLGGVYQEIADELNDIVDDAVALIEADARKRNIHITTALARDLAEVQADRVMIEQVLLNLIRNGMDAMAGSSAERRRLQIDTRADGEDVQVAVRDSGAGIPPDIAEKLFAPFFTTKPDGMGMGLNICRSIVELHHGRLWFEAAEGGGTVFILKLPAADAQALPA